MTANRFAVLIFSGIALLAACASPTPPATPNVIKTDLETEVPSEPAPSPTLPPTESPRSFRVIGYATEAMIVEAIPFEKLTHINYAFLLPNNDGTFVPLTNSWNVKGLVQRGHQIGVKVLISIGGWGWDEQFEQVAANPQTRAVFIKEALKVVEEYGFDGVDIDWEYPDPGTSAQNYAKLMQELRAALPDKLLTTAVISYGDDTGLGIPPEVFNILDFINVMTYDEPGHATMEQFQEGLEYWLGRGVPAEKLVMGIPFYTRPGEISFRKLVQSDPAAAGLDVFNYFGREERYNGIPTVQKKTLLAMDKASGIMFWNLEHDATGDKSLLNTIYQTIISKKH